MAFRTLMRTTEEFDTDAILLAMNETGRGEAVYDKLVIIGQLMGALEPVMAVFVVERRPKSTQVENNVFGVRYDIAVAVLREWEARGSFLRQSVSVVSE